MVIKSERYSVDGPSPGGVDKIVHMQGDRLIRCLGVENVSGACLSRVLDESALPLGEGEWPGFIRRIGDKKVARQLPGY